MITEPGATSEDDKLRAGAPCIRTQGPTYKPFSYESRSLRSPFFCLALPFLWSERPSLFLPLSPVRAPPASFIRPLALSIFPSSFSSLLPLPPNRPIRLLLSVELPFSSPPEVLLLLAAGQLVRKAPEVFGGVRDTNQGSFVLEPLPVALLLCLPGLGLPLPGLRLGLGFALLGAALGLLGLVAGEGTVGLLGLAHRLVHVPPCLVGIS